jgi:hypothetical protein
MLTNHDSPATLLLSGKVLVAGGSTSNLYDPSTGQWTSPSTLYYTGGTGTSAALLANGDVLIYGNKFSCYAGQFYNPSTNTWARTQGQCGSVLCRFILA